MPGSTSLNMATGNYTLLLSGEQGTFSQVEQVTMSNGNDTVIGSIRNDIIIAAKGNDTVNGADGNDFIAGNYGRDTLTGGLGADKFDYNQLSESTTNVNIRDTITDFVFNLDKIDLSTLDAQAIPGGNQTFTAFIGAAAFTAEGQIRAVQSGANTIVEVNTTGVTGAEMQIVLANFTATNLDLGDFVA
jgi:Ca2+-binding RTX toxin-like protein